MSNRDRNISSRCCHQIQHIVRLLVALNHSRARQLLPSPGLLSQLLFNSSEPWGGSSCTQMCTQAPGTDHQEVGMSQNHPRKSTAITTAFSPAHLQLWGFKCPLAQLISRVACTQGFTGKMAFTAPAQSVLESSSRAMQHRESSGTEDVVPAENQENAVNPQPSSL